VTLQQASNDLNTVAAQMAKQYPTEDDQFGIRLVTRACLAIR